MERDSAHYQLGGGLWLRSPLLEKQANGQEPSRLGAKASLPAPSNRCRTRAHEKPTKMRRTIDRRETCQIRGMGPGAAE